MLKHAINRWDLTIPEAIALQRELAQHIVREGSPREVRSVAGIDLAFGREAGFGRAAVVVMEYPSLYIIETQIHEAPLEWPYIPGLLSFREVPCMLGALAQLTVIPDLLLVDGMGIAHPRRLGNAAHLGLWMTIPTIGCGKKRLVGTYDVAMLGEAKGAQVPLRDRGEIIGAVVRTRAEVHPLFVSVGNHISLSVAVEYVLACTTRYRLPEPVRIADRLSKGL